MNRSTVPLHVWQAFAQRFVDRTEWIGPGACCPFCREPAPIHQAGCFVVSVKDALQDVAEGTRS